MDFARTLKPFSKNDWDTISLYSGHTSRDTGGQPSSSFTYSPYGKDSRAKPARGRMLERDADDYLIRTTVKRGKKSQSGGYWKFELNGVVAIVSSDHPEQDTSITFKLGFLMEHTYRQAGEKYKQLTDALANALDSEDRIVDLQRYLGPQYERIFWGVDLDTVPLDTPLLHHCAGQGYHECVRALLDAEFSPGYAGKKMFTLLHWTAWGGSLEVFDAISNDIARKLCDIVNDYGELPENAAFHQACEYPERQDAFSEIAHRCHALRTGERKGSTYFNEQANKHLVRMLDKKRKRFSPYYGTDPSRIVEEMEKLNSCFEHLIMRQIAFGEYFARFLNNQSRNFNLSSLRLTQCGLDKTHAAMLASFLKASRGTITDISLDGNPLTDCGLRALLIRGFLCIQNINLSMTSLTSAGLLALCEKHNIIAVVSLLVADNDFSENALDGTSATHSLGTWLAHEHCSLRELSLTKTRLNSAQLRHLFDQLHYAHLEKLHLLRLNLDFMAPQSNKLIDAIRSPHNSLKKIDISVTENPTLQRAVYEALYAKKKTALYEASSNNDPERILGSENKFSSAAYHMRLKECKPPSLVTKTKRVTFHTPLGFFSLNSISPDIDISPEDVGQWYEVTTFGGKAIAGKDITGGISSLRLLPAGGPLCIAECIPLLYCAKKSSVLLFGKRKNSASGLFARKFRNHFFHPYFTLEERFPGVMSRKTHAGRPPADWLLQDVDLSKFSDAEVVLCASLDKCCCFERLLTVGDDDEVVSTNFKCCSFEHAKQCQTFWDVRRFFKQEMQKRGLDRDPSALDLAVDVKYDFESTSCEGTWFPRCGFWKEPESEDVWWSLVKERVHLQFVAAMTIQGAPAWRDSVHNGQFIRLMLIGVDDLDEVDEMPLGLSPKEDQFAKWVPVVELDQYVQARCMDFPRFLDDVRALCANNATTAFLRPTKKNEAFDSEEQLYPEKTVKKDKSGQKKKKEKKGTKDQKDKENHPQHQHL